MNHNKLESLSPKNNLYKNNGTLEYNYYKEVLDSALSDDANKNIAFSGKYGSGKSSLIYSYLNDESSLINGNRALKVNFSNLSENNDFGEKVANEISLSIINQIIYQISSNKIPKTHFKIKSSMGKMKKILLFCSILFSILFFIIRTINIYFFNLLNYGITIILTMSWGILIYSAVKTVDFEKIKIGFHGVEANINYEKDNFFERYIDEILYLFSGFENQSKDKKNSNDYVLVIEDLDRFNNTDIFIKLKDLNIKLNQHSKKHWVFLYLIKDSMFEGKTERTKFFDLIIPVLPFLTAYNSYDKLKLFFESDISDNLLYYLSNFIDDYRLLLNIFNEYTIFNDLSNHSINNKNELLSLIAYKNLYPSSYDDLQADRGLLTKIIRNHKSNITEIIKEKEKEINDNEVNALYKYASENNYKMETHRYGYLQYIPINNVEDARSVINNDLTINLWNDNNLKYSQLLSNDENYKNNYLMYSYINQEKEKLRKLRTYDLRYINKDILPEEDKSNKDEFEFIFSLISEGFITAGYLSTVNFFYGNTNNEIFMNKLYNHDDNFDVSLNIDSINILINRMSNKEYFFEYPQILNLDLFRYILEKERYDKAKKIINVSRRVEKDSSGYLFIEKFIEKYSNFLSVIYRLNSNITIQIAGFNYSETTLSYIIDKDIYEHTEDNNMAIVSHYNDLGDDVVKPILNNDNVDLEVKYKICDKIQYVDLKEINDYRLWNHLMKINKVKYTINNAIEYKGKYEELDRYFYRFLNNIPFCKDVNKVNENNVDFFKSIIKDEQVDYEKLSEIVSENDEISFDGNDITDLSDDRVSFIINNCNIDINEDVFNRIICSSIDIRSDSKCLYLIKKCNSFDPMIEVKNEKLLNAAYKNSDISSFKFVTDRLSEYSFNNAKLSRYLNYISKYNKDYTSDLIKVINIINKRKNSQNAKIVKDDSGIMINILSYLKELKIIDNYILSEHSKKIKFH